MKVEEVINQLGPKVPSQQISHTVDTLAEITKVYHEIYASGLSNFFENNWFYFTENGKMSFPREARAIEMMSYLLTVLGSSTSNVPDQGSTLDDLETRVVWELAKTAFTVTSSARPAPQAVLPPCADPLEAKRRVQVVETLLSGESLVRNPLSPPYHDADTQRVRQFDFWYALGELLRQRDDHYGAAASKIREDCLARMRSLLDGRENRDVLYSIAVIREMGPKYALMDPSTIPQHVNETDPRCRFVVASRFIASEAQAKGGSTNVLRRLSKIAVLAHINRGVCLQEGV